MSRRLLIGLLFASLAGAQDSANIAVFHRQNAILSTRDGIRAATELKAAFADELGKAGFDRAQLEAEKARLQRMNAGHFKRLPWKSSARKRLSRRIDADTKTVHKKVEDDRVQFERTRSRIMAILDARMTQVVEDYAKQNGFIRIIDATQSPAGSRDLTREIVQSYDNRFSGPAPFVETNDETNDPR